MRKRYVKILLVILVVVAIGATAYYFLRPQPVIPAAIKTQLTSTLLMPTDKTVAVIDQGSIKYDSKIKVLTYDVQFDGVKVVISEQPTPESFIDIADVYTKVLESMNEYKKFELAIGVIHLTRPPDLKGKQSAVLNSKGTLLFANPKQDLTEDQWRRFFHNIQLVN
jgi:hypothetical protein